MTGFQNPVKKGILSVKRSWPKGLSLIIMSTDLKAFIRHSYGR